MILPNFSVGLASNSDKHFIASRRATSGIGATPSSSLSSPRRCRSSGALFFSYLGDEDETVRIDLSADPDVRKEIRLPQVRKTKQTFLGSFRKSPFVMDTMRLIECKVALLVLDGSLVHNVLAKKYLDEPW